MPKPVRAALVGAGGYAGKHLVPHIPSFEGLRYVAVCDTNPKAARRAARRIGVDDVTDDLGAVLTRDDVEMVDLQTPNFLHAEQAEAAFAAGKHVLVQKPIAPSIADAKRIRRAAERAGCRLGVYMDDLNDPLLWDMKAAIAAGFLGRPTAFHLRYAHGGGLRMGQGSWRRDAARTGGGSFTLLTIHNVCALTWLLETRVRRVTAFQATLLAPMEGDDSTAGALELETGVVGTAGSSYIFDGCPGAPGTVTEVLGTEGVFRHLRDYRRLTAWTKGPTFDGAYLKYNHPWRTRDFRRKKTELRRPTIHEQFARAIRTGEEVLWSGERGLDDLAVCLAMAESARTGRPVEPAALIAAG